MLKYFKHYALLASLLLPISGYSSVDHNIAKGLPPVVKGQSISVLQPFKVIFVFWVLRFIVLTRKPNSLQLIMPSVGGCLLNLKLPDISP